MSVKVAVRVRPFNERQMFLGCSLCVAMQGQTTTIRDYSKKQHKFSYDYSFWSHDGHQPDQQGYFLPASDKYADQNRVFTEFGREIINNAWYMGVDAGTDIIAVYSPMGRPEPASPTP